MSLTDIVRHVYACPDEHKKPSEWDGALKEEGLGLFAFQNRLSGEPLDLVSTCQWNGWTTIDFCKICGSGPHYTTYEVIFEWGDTGSREYVGEICSQCMNHIYTTIIRNNAQPKTY